MQVSPAHRAWKFLFLVATNPYKYLAAESGGVLLGAIDIEAVDPSRIGRERVVSIIP